MQRVTVVCSSETNAQLNMLFNHGPKGRTRGYMLDLVAAVGEWDGPGLRNTLHSPEALTKLPALLDKFFKSHPHYGQG